ncbi:transporter [Saccharopolyspora gregorii]|uniref:Transporter n=1 Tax=Saccharopolyspora gregorii TaxID=33914 RepID=A0ABP6RT13_9PSEU|nr:transporter [Saccharopolyspora gregorii]
MERTLWVLALLALLVLVYFGMRRGWLNRKRRQDAEFAAFPAAPADVAERPALLADQSGFYVGSTKAGDWQDRIVVGDIGHRANAVAKLRDSGLLLERTGASPMWIPAESVLDARVDHKLANKVVPGAGLLVVTWRLGDQDIDTGFRADDKSTQDEWAGAVRALAPAAGRDDNPEGQA